MSKRRAVLFQTSKDITIVADTFGNSRDQPVLLIHGGGQTRHSWKSTGSRLEKAGYYAIAIDCRGHGESSWSIKKEYTVQHLASDIIYIAKTLDQKPILIGASMGGISSMFALADLPNLAKALILVDISPRMEQKGVERILNFMATKPEGFKDLEEVQQLVASYLPDRDQPPNKEGLKKNLRKLPNGRWAWHWDPAMLNHWLSIHNEIGVHNLSGHLNQVLKSLVVPGLLVRGGSSDVVSKEIAMEVLSIAPQLHYADVADAGHMVAGDSNHKFLGAILDFLQNHNL